MSTGGQLCFTVSDVRHNEGRRVSISSSAEGGGRRIYDRGHGEKPN